MKNNISKIKITDQLIDNILYKLKIISHLKQGDKLYNGSIFTAT